jgi:hypothetical protein
MSEEVSGVWNLTIQTFCFGPFTRNTIVHIAIVDLQSRYYNCWHYHTGSLFYLANRLTPRNVRQRSVRRYTSRPLTRVRRVLVQRCTNNTAFLPAVFKEGAGNVSLRFAHTSVTLFIERRNFKKLSKPKGGDWRQLSDKIHVMSLYRVIKKSLCTWWLQYRKL